MRYLENYERAPIDGGDSALLYNLAVVIKESLIGIGDAVYRDTSSAYDLQDRKQCAFDIQNKSTTIRSHEPEPKAEYNPRTVGRSDPDLAIGISVCSHIITRADGYKFTSNTMAIHHRDIIKVMPIAPARTPSKRRISLTTSNRNQT
ncbi:hypothetical protein ACJJTC_004549 [Scirpophaga incertulas]